MADAVAKFTIPYSILCPGCARGTYYLNADNGETGP
jgi:hypothetical protein